jgi:hypothetical protein
MTAAAEIPSATIASADARRANISAAVSRVDAIQISPDLARTIVFLLGNYAKLARRANGCTPDWLEDIQYALAEACASDSHGASPEAILAVGVPQSLVDTKAAAKLLGVKETTIRYHFAKGNLRGTKVGTALMINEHSLAEFRANREREEV